MEFKKVIPKKNHISIDKTPVGNIGLLRWLQLVIIWKKRCFFQFGFVLGDFSHKFTPPKASREPLYASL